ncbi:MAG: hypothetical protein E5299_01023 [Burkholderia gladioli]|nr:MAG: hypothetical protein E5299_01023 [Burkholderia gladioli]
MQLPVTVVENGRKTVAYHRRSLAANTLYRFKTLSGNCLWEHHIDSQATSFACESA